MVVVKFLTAVSLWNAIGGVLCSAVLPTLMEPGCVNGPHSRGCWGNFSINADYSKTFPVTGRTVSYNLELVNMTLAPDGQPKVMSIINGQYPGPQIVADWGDILEITVTNKLQTNGTSFHWHGIRQLGSNTMDGVNGITECPLAPGTSKTYRFHCTQYGTSWYHSHFSAQYGDGAVGTIQINGPATADYDVDLGVMPITDVYYDSYTHAVARDQFGPDHPADNGLISGTMVSPDGTKGKYNIVNSLKPGLKYRLRLVNTGVQDQFRVSLDNHPFQVIATDFVPIVPYTTNWLFVGIGQRYDVIFEASQTPGSYWFRADAQNCTIFGTTNYTTADNSNNFNIRSIFAYEGNSTLNVPLPNTTATAYDPGCLDDTSITPWLPQDVASTPFETNSGALDVAGAGNVTDLEGVGVFAWEVNGIVFEADWADPTLNHVQEGNSTFSERNHVIGLPNANEWTYWIISTPHPVNHPIHLHGHDFSFLGRGTGTFPGTTALNFQNPPRRDVTMLPALGWLVIAFETNNPGAWILHCHIAFHVAQGLAVQFLERSNEIPQNMDLSVLNETCSNWATFQATMPFKQSDSGV